MRKEIIFSIIIVFVAVILFFVFKPGKNVDANIENIGAKYHQQDFIVSPNMRDAFTNEQRHNLSISWGAVYSIFKEVADSAREINSSENLNERQKSNVLKFAQLVISRESTMSEIKNEIDSPAESLDNKIAQIIGVSFVLVDLSKEIKNGLSGTKFEESSEKLYDSTTVFFEKINVFENLFFSMFQLKNKNFTINPDIVTAFDEMNDTEIAKFSQYDGRRFFNEIKENFYVARAESAT